MSIKLMNLAWEMELPLGQKMVLMALADRANADGECWPGQASLAKMCSMSERALRDNIDRLASQGLVTVISRRVDGHNGTSKYHLTLTTQPAESAGWLPADCDKSNRQIATEQPADRDIAYKEEPTIKQPTVEPSVASKSRPQEKITFDAAEKKFNIPLERYPDWERAFPKLDLDTEIDKAELWLSANPKRRKKNYDRFLLGWFSRAAENAKPRVFVKQQPLQHQAR